MGKRKEIEPGTRFGTWTTVGNQFKPEDAKQYWSRVECDCGNLAIMHSGLLTSGQAVRCWSCYNSNRPTILAPAQVVVNAVYHDYKKGAARRGLEFKLTKQDLHQFIFNDCFYCGRQPQNKVKDRIKNPRELPQYNGIDRINNLIGYVSGNCVSCCRWCNEAKRAKSPEEWMEWIDGIGRRAKYNVSAMKVMLDDFK